MRWPAGDDRQGGNRSSPPALQHRPAARAEHRLLELARTIADPTGARDVAAHAAEALRCRPRRSGGERRIGRVASGRRRRILGAA